MNQKRGLVLVLVQLLAIVTIPQSITAENEVGLMTPEQNSTSLQLKENKNVCLKKPEDKYRTCFQRAVDPSNNLSEDTILRDEYNEAAKEYAGSARKPRPSKKPNNKPHKEQKASKSGKGSKHVRRLSKSSKNGSSKSSKGKTSDGVSGKSGKGAKASSHVEPYTPPYVMANEELIHGTIYLSIVHNKAVDKMSCDDKIELEEVTIEWLHDNLGGKDSFTPLCAYNDGYEFHEEVVVNTDGSKDVIETAAFKMDLVFATKKDWFSNSASLFDRRRLSCTEPSVNLECCSADTINNSMTKAQKAAVRESCNEKGCNINQCPVKAGRRLGFSHDAEIPTSLQSVVTRFLIENNLLGTDFNDAMDDYTDLKPIVSGALLDATSLEDLTVCRANNYNVVENDEPIITCNEYKEADCEINDYLILEGNSTLSPTLLPTGSPSMSPTLSPSMSPTLSPSMSPTSSTVPPTAKPNTNSTAPPSAKPTTNSTIPGPVAQGDVYFISQPTPFPASKPKKYSPPRYLESTYLPSYYPPTHSTKPGTNKPSKSPIVQVCIPDDCPSCDGYVDDDYIEG